MSGMTRRDASTAQLMKTHGFSARTDYHKDKQDAQAVRELASEILRLTRSTLLINMRFLESALVRFVPGDETVTPEMATDGRFLYYNSIHICRLFKTSPQLVCRDYLHLTFHCIFRHLFVGEKLNGELWDLACDIAVEHLITGLGLKSLYAERQEKQSWLTDKLKEQMPRLTAERIYRYLVEQDLPPQEIGRIREYFYADDHRIWHKHGHRMPDWCGMFITFFFINILWVLFRADNLHQAWVIIRSMFDNTNLSLTKVYTSHLPSIMPNTVNMIILFIAIMLALLGPTAYRLMTDYPHHRLRQAMAIACFVTGIFFISRVVTFLYFNF